MTEHQYLIINDDTRISIRAQTIVRFRLLYILLRQPCYPLFPGPLALRPILPDSLLLSASLICVITSRIV